MIDLIYTAGSGRVYNLKADPLRASEDNTFHAWEFGKSVVERQYGERLLKFTKSALVQEVNLRIRGNYQTRKKIIEQLHMDFELDIAKQKQGKIQWGDYYLTGYFIGSETVPSDDNYETINECKFYAPYPFWLKNKVKTFNKMGDEMAQYDYLDYEFDYKYDFYPGQMGSVSYNTNNAFESEFLMRIYGDVVNPSVMINGHVYQVYVTLGQSEYLEIDSTEGTVYRVQQNGTRLNVFDYRNKASSIFEKIPGGTVLVNWTGLFKFDLILYQERSEPLG